MSVGLSDPAIRLEMRSDPMLLAGARELVSAICRRLGFDDLSCCQIALAVDEALANVICHGYARQDDGKIWLSIHPVKGDPPTLKVMIEDEAKQVEIADIKGRELSDIRPGGLGVHIIRQVMDVVVYEKRDGGRGMRLILEKTGDVRSSNADGPCVGEGEGD